MQIKISKYNGYVKLAGQTLTFKTYQKEQHFNLQARTTFSPKKEVSSKEREEYLEKRRVQSGIRAKNRVFDLIASNVGKHKDFEGIKQKVKFLTLTFRDNVKDVEQANREFTNFVKRLSYHLYGIKKNVIKYIAVPELQERGAVHYHVLLLNVKFVPFNDLIAIWGLGSVFINAISSTKKNQSSSYIARYITKYVGKAFANGVDFVGKKRYFTSRGLKKPFERYISLTNKQIEEILELVIESKSSSSTVYAKTYDNEYRGLITVYTVDIKKQVLPVIRTIANGLFSDAVDYLYNKKALPNFRYLKNYRFKRDIADYFGVDLNYCLY